MIAVIADIARNRRNAEKQKTKTNLPFARFASFAVKGFAFQFSFFGNFGDFGNLVLCVPS